jgi:sulfite exporter TauE/SafE
MTQTLSSSSRFVSIAGLVGFFVLVAAVLVPGGLFWTAILAAALIGSAVATAVLMRNRGIPTLARVVATAKVEYVPYRPATDRRAKRGFAHQEN